MEPRGSRAAFQGRVIRVDVEEWPGVGPYEVIHHLGAAAVLPITPGGDALLVRQFRPPIRQAIIEIPAGLLDLEGEEAVRCAERELLEETGYRHTEIEFLGGVYTSVGMTDEYVHLFLARTESEPVSLPEEGIELVRLPFAQVVAAARSGEVRDSKTALALLLAAARVPGA